MPRRKQRIHDSTPWSATTTTGLLSGKPPAHSANERTVTFAARMGPRELKSCYALDQTVRRELMNQADVHTLLRWPTGIIYAQGVKTNVLFFDRKPAQD
jgi:hypothetical protein